jgi:uncharacterized alpha-E superfamily protein
MPMLSRVADSLYWMGRYFERAEHCARVIEANYNVLLNPSRPSTEYRWQRVAGALGLTATDELDPQPAMKTLIRDTRRRLSILACITAARENASQVREQISSEMWERLNRLFHDVKKLLSESKADTDLIDLVAAVREGSYAFHGATDTTMNRGEGWHFIQFGKYLERACALPLLISAYYVGFPVKPRASERPDDFDGVGLLSSCAAFEGYTRVYTADLRAERIAEFLLLNPEFPHTIRFSVERMHEAHLAISERTSTRKAARMDHLIGRLRSSLAFVQIEEILARDLNGYLAGVVEQCRNLHGALHEVFIEYPIEAAIEV